MLVEGAKGGAGKGNAGKEANNFLITFDGKANRYEITDVADISTSRLRLHRRGPDGFLCGDRDQPRSRSRPEAGTIKAKVSATPASSVTLEGEDGNDTLSGGDDATGETLNGGKGNDLMLGGNGPDQFIGAQGFDSVSYSDHTTAGVVTTIGTTADDGNAADGPPTARDSIDKTVEKVAGTSFADLLTGSRNDDVLVGLAGNDRLKGLAGADIFKGKGGIDILLARDGHADKKLDCGPGKNSRERAKLDRGLDPAAKSC